MLLVWNAPLSSALYMQRPADIAPARVVDEDEWLLLLWWCFVTGDIIE